MSSTGDSDFRAHPAFSRFYLIAGSLLNRLVGPARQVQSTMAQGLTLIAGAGSGLDVDLVLKATRDVVLLEPDPTFIAHLHARYPNLPLLATPAERIQASDNTYDTILSSLVLCSVQNLNAALKEFHRVLKPGGQFLFLEHGRHPAQWASQIQTILDPVWTRLNGGCHLTRDVLDAITANGLTIQHADYVSTNPVAPLLAGQATKGANPRQILREIPH